MGSSPSHGDSDVDLQDALDYTHLGGSDAHGTITPSFLAKHYLPDIVLNNGPMPIRLVMQQLSNSLPGFADIPPAKARRIVVAGLENRQGGSEAGRVEFEKVGWGRWDAKLKGQASRAAPNPHSLNRGQPSPPASVTLKPQVAAVQIPNRGINHHRARRPSHESWATETSTSGRPDNSDADMLDQDVERMSLDEDDSNDKHRYRRRTYNSETDEEDWARIGADGLTASSNPSGGGFRLQLPGLQRRPRTRSPFVMAPPSTPPQHGLHSYQPSKMDVTRWDSQGVEAGPEEREAAEALLRMGSL